MRDRYPLLGILVAVFLLGSCAVNPVLTVSPTSPATLKSTVTVELLVSPTNEPTSTMTSTAVPDAVTPELTPTSSATATPVKKTCKETSGTIEERRMDSELLPMDMFYRVYTPPCYDSKLNERYPVLYLIHGQSYTDDQWDRLGMDETADRLISAGEIPPLIIVMPRDRIWVPPPEDAFGESLITELIPEIDLQYRTRANRDYRAIGGLSRGGNWALHLGLQHWELFSSIGAHSTPSFVVDGPNRVRGWLESIPRSRLPRIFMDVGESDRWLEQIMNLEAVIDEAGVPHEWYLYPGYHEEEYWESHVEQYLRWYAEEW